MGFWAYSGLIPNYNQIITATIAAYVMEHDLFCVAFDMVNAAPETVHIDYSVGLFVFEHFLPLVLGVQDFIKCGLRN
jgi:hypothetical protein